MNSRKYLVIGFALLRLLSLPIALAQISSIQAIGGGGSEAGNGGSAIVCRDSNGAIQSVELLDFFEGRQIHGYIPDLGPDTLSVKEKIELFLARLKERGVSDITLGSIHRTLKLFEGSVQYFSGQRLVEIPDSNALIIPEKCAQEQIAVQRVRLSSADHIFTINQDLFNHPTFSVNQKAGLILHEVLYYESLHSAAHQVTTSVPIRYFLSKYADSRFAHSLSELANDLGNLDFSFISYQGYTCILSSLEFVDENRISSCEIPDYMPAHFSLQGRDRVIHGVRFSDESGAVDGILLSQPELLTVGNRPLWFVANNWLNLNPAGAILGGALAYDREARFTEPDWIDLMLDGKPHDSVPVIFDADGKLLLCKSCRGSVTVVGRKLRIRAPNPNDAKDGVWSLYLDHGMSGLLELVVENDSEYPVLGVPAFWTGRLVINRKDDFVFQGTLSRPVELPFGRRKVRVTGRIILTSDSIDEAELAEDVTLPYCEQGEVRFLKGMRVQFHENECVKKAIQTLF